MSQIATIGAGQRFLSGILLGCLVQMSELLYRVMHVFLWLKDKRIQEQRVKYDKDLSKAKKAVAQVFVCQIELLN